MKPFSKSEWMTPAACGRGVAGVDRPGARFLLAGGEVGAQAEQVVGRADERRHARVRDAEVGEVLARLGVRQLGELGLDLRGDDDRLGAEVRLGVLADRRRRAGEFVSAVASSSSATLQAKSIGFEVSRKNRRATAFSSGESGRGERALAGVRGARASLSATASDSFASLSPPRASFSALSLRARDRLEVGEDELGLDRLDVGDRVERAGDVDDVLVLEAAHDLDDRVDLADVLEELVAEALALGGALDQAGDVHELDRRPG